MEAKQLIEEIKNKHSFHDEYEERLQPNLIPSDGAEPSWYEWKKIGYELVENFKDRDFSKAAFLIAIEVWNDGDADKEDLVDIIDDITFLDTDWASQLKNEWDIEVE
jgi:hypothetical protein